MSYNREYYLKNREKYLEATKKYIAKKRAEKDKEWLSERNEYMKEYYLKNPDKRKAKNNYDKNYYQLHKDYFKAKQKEYLLPSFLLINISRKKKRNNPNVITKEYINCPLSVIFFIVSPFLSLL